MIVGEHEASWETTALRVDTRVVLTVDCGQRRALPALTLEACCAGRSVMD